MDNLNYSDISMQKYFYDNNFNKKESQTLFKYRTRMSNFAANFPNGSSDLTCPLCKDENSLDSESHSFHCRVLNILLPETINKDSTDIYAKDTDILKEAMIIMTQIIDLRSELLN